MIKNIVKIHLILIGLLMLSSCSSTNKNVYKTNPCHNITQPTWLDDAYVGVARQMASGSKSEQKIIATQRAIAMLLMSKGRAQGKSVISVTRELNVVNKKESFHKNFSEGMKSNITFENISYEIEIKDIWRDPCSDELYVKIQGK